MPTNWRNEHLYSSKANTVIKDGLIKWYISNRIGPREYSNLPVWFQTSGTDNTDIDDIAIMFDLLTHL